MEQADGAPAQRTDAEDAHEHGATGCRAQTSIQPRTPRKQGVDELASNGCDAVDDQGPAKRAKPACERDRLAESMAARLHKHNLTPQHLVALHLGQASQLTVTLGTALADPESLLAEFVCSAACERGGAAQQPSLWTPCAALDLPADPDVFRWIVRYLEASSLGERPPLPTGDTAELLLLQAKRWRLNALVEALNGKLSPTSVAPRRLCAPGAPSWSKYKIDVLVSKLAAGLVDREHMIRRALLASIAGEHVLLLGPPGTAKSLLARRLHLAYHTGGEGAGGDGAYFERLLTRFSTPEELFGPMSIQKLQADQYERKIEGYLPTAQIAFVDEIFKANSAVLNSLLTIINERLFHNGTNVITVPLISMIGASNEVPGQTQAELQALYDRFLVRMCVGYLRSRDTHGRGVFMDMVLGDAGEVTAASVAQEALSGSDLRDIEDRARNVVVPEDVQDLILQLRSRFCGTEWQVSDRRWKNAVYLMRVAAATDGRAEVRKWDLLHLTSCVWHQPEQEEEVEQFVVGLLTEDIGVGREFMSHWDLRRNTADRELSDADSVQDVQRVLSQVADLTLELERRAAALLQEISDMKSLLAEDLWLDVQHRQVCFGALDQKHIELLRLKDSFLNVKSRANAIKKGIKDAFMNGRHSVLNSDPCRGTPCRNATIHMLRALKLWRGASPPKLLTTSRKGGLTGHCASGGPFVFLIRSETPQGHSIAALVYTGPRILPTWICEGDLLLLSVMVKGDLTCRAWRHRKGSGSFIAAQSVAGPTVTTSSAPLITFCTPGSSVRQGIEAAHAPCKWEPAIGPKRPLNEFDLFGVGVGNYASCVWELWTL